MGTTPESNHQQAHREQSASRSKWVFVGFAAIAAFFLFTEHRAHVLGALPFLLLLACPLMHLFHHGGHGKRLSGHDQDKLEGGGK